MRVLPAIIVVLVFAAPASAVTTQGAHRLVERKARHLARAFSKVEKPDISVGACKRRSRSRVDCGVTYRFDASHLTCRHVMRVLGADRPWVRVGRTRCS